MTLSFKRCNPNRGSVEGGFDTVISGSGLQNITKISFGGRRATLKSRYPASEIAVTVPPRSKAESVDLTIEYEEGGQKKNKKIASAFQYVAFKKINSLADSAKRRNNQQQQAAAEQCEKDCRVSYFRTARGATVITYDTSVLGHELRTYLATRANTHFQGMRHLHVFTGVEGADKRLDEVYFERSFAQSDQRAIDFYDGYPNWGNDRTTIEDLTAGGALADGDLSRDAIIAKIQDPNINDRGHVICLNWCYSVEVYQDLIRGNHIR